MLKRISYIFSDIFQIFLKFKTNQCGFNYETCMLQHIQVNTLYILEALSSKTC